MTTIENNNNIMMQSMPKGNDAANELWELIQGSSLPSHHVRSSPPQHSPQHSPRFAEAQRDRTVHHHTLKQPSAEDELLFLEEGQTQSFNKSMSSLDIKKESEATLVRRLSVALLGAQCSVSDNLNSYGETGNDTTIDEEYWMGDGSEQSPTSTLNFPDSSSSNIKNPYQEQPPSDDGNIYCQFIDLNPAPQDGTNKGKVATKVPFNLDTLPKKKSKNTKPKNITELETNSPSHRFVVCADPQLGMTSQNEEWNTELEYCQSAVKKINSLEPRPKFACVCGDMLNHVNRPDFATIRKLQTKDFKDIMSKLHKDIALVCLCGNHDVGNRPTPQTISQYRTDFGDEYLAFWTNGTYNIILNNVLFNNPEGAPEMFNEQLEWLEERLNYANKFNATQIYIFAHHPWFLYDEHFDADQMKGVIPSPPEWDDGSGKFDKTFWPDSYFCVPMKYRTIALDLFKKYNVTSCFSGHFHQNLVSKTSWGMDMIVTGPISMIFESTANEDSTEKGRGIRIVDVFVNQKEKLRTKVGDASFTHRYENF